MGGFRTQDSRLPVAPVFEGVAPTFNPEPLEAPVDTPEVAAAKAEHLAAVEAAKAGKEKREAEPGFAYGFATAHPTYAPFATYALDSPTQDLDMDFPTSGRERNPRANHRLLSYTLAGARDRRDRTE